MSKITVDEIADYICFKYLKSKRNISVSLLHKLLYYSQAWYLGKHKKALFSDEFEAWTFGPVCRHIDERFKDRVKTLSIEKESLNLEALESVPDRILNHVDAVLSKFEGMSAVQIEDLFVESETPWKETRKNMRSTEQSNDVISKKLIYEHYYNKKDEI
jgi:uncharacterized phage-associated protein